MCCSRESLCSLLFWLLDRFRPLSCAATVSTSPELYSLDVPDSIWSAGVEKGLNDSEILYITEINDFFST